MAGRTKATKRTATGRGNTRGSGGGAPATGLTPPMTYGDWKRLGQKHGFIQRLPGMTGDTGQSTGKRTAKAAGKTTLKTGRRQAAESGQRAAA